MQGCVFTTHDEIHFDSDDYVNINYRNFNPNDKSNTQQQMRCFIIKSLCDIYKTGNVSGNLLLDIGCGPVCYSPAPACPWVNGIVLCDKSQENCSILEKWKEGENTHQEAIVQHIAGIMESGSDWKSLDRILAEKVSRIVVGDMKTKPFLSGTDLEDTKFDVVTAILAISSASVNEAEYRQCVKNISYNLKKGGYLIVADTSGKPTYTVGQYTFKVESPQLAVIRDIYTCAGFTILEMMETSLKENSLVFRCFCMLAKKL